MNETQSQPTASAVAGADLNTADLRPVDANEATRSAPAVLLNGEEIKIEGIKEIPQIAAGARVKVSGKDIRRARNTQQLRLATPLIEQLMARSPECQPQSGRDWEVLKDRVEEFGSNQVKMADSLESLQAIGRELPGFAHSAEFLNARQIFDDSIVKTAPIFNELLNEVEGHKGNVKLADEADYLNLADRTMTQLTEQTTIYEPITSVVHDEMRRMRTFKAATDEIALADPKTVSDVAFKEVPAEAGQA